MTISGHDGHLPPHPVYNRLVRSLRAAIHRSAKQSRLPNASRGA